MKKLRDRDHYTKFLAAKKHDLLNKAKLSLPEEDREEIATYANIFKWEPLREWYRSRLS